MKKAVLFDFAGTLVKMRPPMLLTEKSLLASLSNKYALAIITGAKRTETLNILRKLGVLNFFSLIITKDDVKYSKPDKRLYLLAKRKLNFNQCVYIGDSLGDYEFSLNAKIPFLYIGGSKVGFYQNTDINNVLNFLIKNFPVIIE